MLTGYEQVRSVVAALAGDWDAARRIELSLPATGVCSATPARESCATETSCCESQPVVVGATLSAPRRR
jgi:hypothetical protein